LGRHRLSSVLRGVPATAAADVVKTLGNTLVDIAGGIGDFFSSLVSTLS
jgi:hypothetical protein